MQLSNRVPLLIILAGTAIFGGANYVSYRAQVSYIDNFKAEQLADIAAEISSGLVGFQRGAASYATLVATLPSVQQAFRDRDRDRLVKELAPSFKNARAKYSAEGGMFQLPELRTFLRLTRADLHGEDVSHRDMIVRANRDRKAQSGLETTISRVGVRAVVPVISSVDSSHLGSFEWGFGLSRLLQRVKENYDADVALLVDERTFTAPITSRGAAAKAAAAKAAEADRIAEGYRTVETTDVELMRHLVTRDTIVTLDHTVIRSLRAGGVEHGVVAVPISDYSGRKLGAICIAKSMAEPQRKVRATQVTFLAATTVGMILLAGAIQLVFNGLLVRPLVELGECVDAIAKGDVRTKIDLKRRGDEIGSMARNVDRVRERLAKENELAERRDKISARLAKIEATDEGEKKA